MAFDENQLLTLADSLSSDEANATLAAAAANFTDTGKARPPLKQETESARERAGRWMQLGANATEADGKERGEIVGKLFRLSSKTNLDAAIAIFAAHAAKQQVIAGVIALAQEAVRAAKQREEAGNLAHLKAELNWTKAKAVVESQDLLALVKPLLAFDGQVKVDASGKLSVYIARIASLELEVRNLEQNIALKGLKS
jgi:hypothetical protein